MQRIKLYIGSDHAAYEMKSQIISFLENNYEIIDIGCYSNEATDYPTIAFKLGELVVKDNTIGFLLCGTGFGMNIAVNKVKGIRAISITDPNLAHLAKEHNNANVLCLSGRFNTLENNLTIINNFLNAKFDINDKKNERHLKRLKLISDYENK